MISMILIYIFALLLRISMVSFGAAFNQELQFNPFVMGAIAASYPIGLCCGLLPSGLLIRKWGTKQTLILSLLVMSFGMAMYGFASNEAGLFFGRLFVGISGGAALLAGIRALTQKKQAGRYSGFAMAAGAIGGILAAYPTFELINSYGWRTSCLIYALIGLILIGVVSIATKAEKSAFKGEKTSYLSGIKEAFTSRLFWGRALFPTAIFGAYVAFQTYWMQPYLVDVAKMSLAGASAVATALNVGALVSLLIIATLAKKIAKSIFIQVSCFISLALLYILPMSQMPLLSWAVYGLFAQSAFLIFGYFKKATTDSKYGYYCIASILVTFVFAAAFQLAIGSIVNSQTGYALAYKMVCFTSLAALIVGAIISLTGAKPKKAPVKKQAKAKPKSKKRQLAAR